MASALKERTEAWSVHPVHDNGVPMSGKRRHIARAALHYNRRSAGLTPYAATAVVSAATLAIAALVNRHLANRAEGNHPPSGSFLDMNDGARLHYVERGAGEPLVLLHGNGSMIEDFESSGLIDLAAKQYRVIVFDRPGFAGDGDRIVDTKAQSARLHADILHSGFHLVRGAGHMIQQTATDDIMAAINRVAGGLAAVKT